MLDEFQGLPLADAEYGGIATPAQADINAAYATRAYIRIF
jgi:hypothetical protein